LKEAIDNLVEVGKTHMEVYKGEVPVQLSKPSLKRHGVVLKFDDDSLGNVFWIHYDISKFCQTTNLGWSWSSSIRDVM